MTDLLYLKDSYMKEAKCEVIRAIQGKNIVLDRTIFYPQSGGQPSDKGTFECNSIMYNVVHVAKIGDEIVHEVDKDGLTEHDFVEAKLDWNRRYKLMRSHTAAHLVSAIFHKETEAKITGNQIEEDIVRIDFNLDTFDKEKIEDFINKANAMIKHDAEVRYYWIARKEAEKNKELCRLAKGLPPALQEIRVVEIAEVDKQADAGTHVKHIKEIGKIKFVKAENKGKSNRRVYFEILE